MTLKEIRSLVHFSTNNDILYGAFTSMVNEACRQIQSKRSFTWMQTKLELLVEVGDPYVVLPINYKEPIRGVVNLMVAGQDGVAATSWTIRTQQEALDRFARLGVWDSNTAYIVSEEGEWRLYFSQAPSQSEFTFIFLCYSYQPKLTIEKTVVNTPATGDNGEPLIGPDGNPIVIQETFPPVETNYLLENYPMLVVEKTKELSFSLTGDTDKQAVSEQSFVLQFAQAAAADEALRLSGRSLRMGGF